MQEQQHDPLNKLDDEKSQSMKELISNNTIKSDKAGFRFGKKQINTEPHYVKESQYKLASNMTGNEQRSKYSGALPITNWFDVMFVMSCHVMSCHVMLAIVYIRSSVRSEKTKPIS